MSTMIYGLQTQGGFYLPGAISTLHRSVRAELVECNLLGALSSPRTIALYSAEELAQVKLHDLN